MLSRQSWLRHHHSLDVPHADVYFVVSVDTERTLVTGETHYWIEVVHRDGVGDFGPSLPVPPVLNRRQLASYLLPAAINAERAAFQAPGLRAKLQTTRSRMLQSCYDEYSK